LAPLVNDDLDLVPVQESLPPDAAEVDLQWRIYSLHADELTDVALG
jgi:hypothetical protein